MTLPGRPRRRAIAVATALFGAMLLFAVCRPLPPDLLTPITGTEVRDRHGAVLALRPAPERAFGRAPTLDALGPHIALATLAAEDHRFYLHFGIDILGIARAVRANFRAGRVVEGGSTLTQQLARNLRPRGPGLGGKLGEAGLALRLEAHLSKAEILSEYLSRVYYGNGAVGVDAAARLYFDRPPAALSLAQAATLAALPRRPADLDPIRFPSRAHVARDRVLRRVAARGLAAPEKVVEALAEPLELAAPSTPGAAPHFVRRVSSPEPVVRTTLDLALQRETEQIVADVLKDLRPHRAGQAAVIVVDTPTREVLAYVGSADWRAPDGQVDGVTARRSSGSALKPFLYGLALERGATLADILSDTPGAWSTRHGIWKPENYDRTSAGPVTMRDALARSLNVPAARLAEQVGVAELHRRLQTFGFSTLTERPDHYGLSLALGGAEVRLDELAAAYAALASGGRWQPLRLRLDDPRGPATRALTRGAAFLVFDALDDDAARAPAFGRASVLEAEFPMAAKTGTSTGWRDNWAIGTTPERTVAVWVGNFDATPMIDISGVTGAGPILERVMAAAMQGRPRRAPIPPSELDKARVCPVSGLTPGPHCDASREEWLPRGAPRPSCDWHGPTGLRRPATLGASAGQTVLPVPAVRDTVRIASPAPGATFYVEQSRSPDAQAIPLRVDAPSGGRAVWRVDGHVVADVGPPYAARWVPGAGAHIVEVSVEGVEAPPVHISVAVGP
jgi:penicillin-binding protein 1C